MTDILIATIGTESQVVTLSLLELARLGYVITHVAVVHTNSPDERIQEGLRRLRETFAQDTRLQEYQYELKLITGEQGDVTDITNEYEAEQTFNSILNIVRYYKNLGYRIHLNVAGGRKPMSIYGMVAAQILFDEHDKLWHMVSNNSLVQSRRLFPIEGDEYNLVPIPVIRWQELRQQTQDTPYHIFLETILTPEEYAVVRLMAQGLENNEIAQLRQVKLNTIEKRISIIYQKWVSFWGLAEESQPRRQLVAELAAYWARQSKM